MNKMFKSKALIAAVLMMAVSSMALAASTASYEEMKQIKRAQREAREAQKKSGTQTESKWSQFWKKEGERSGLGQSGNGVGKFMRNLNPAPFFKSQEEQYKARKAAAGK